MDKNFGGVIWTNHALSRLRERGILQGDAWATWRRPDRSYFERSKGVWIYYRNFGRVRIEVAAKQNGKGEWVILSVWSRSLMKLKTQNANLFSLVFKKVLNKLGLLK